MVSLGQSSRGKTIQFLWDHCRDHRGSLFIGENHCQSVSRGAHCPSANRLKMDWLPVRLPPLSPQPIIPKNFGQVAADIGTKPQAGDIPEVSEDRPQNLGDGHRQCGGIRPVPAALAINPSRADGASGKK